MNKIYDIAIIGAGASGLFLASQLKNKTVAVVEKNLKVGRKIQISGGGRCNVTNTKVSSLNYLGDDEFISNVLNQYSNKDLLEYFRQRGLEFVIRDKTQYFCKKTASEVLRVFRKDSKDSDFLTENLVLKATKEDNIFRVVTDKKEICAKSLVIASGGLSYASVGASDIGYEIAKSFGHSIKQTAPALVGFTVQKDEFWFKDLSGISLNCTIKTYNKNVTGNMLFTHKGISGPVVLTASVYWEKGKLEIDFLPNFDLEKIKNSNKFISTVLPVPKRFIKAYLENFGIIDSAFKDLNDSEKDLIKNLKNYKFAPAGNFGYTKAEVTKGGVNTDEIDSLTMQSKIVKDLYFLGEVVDVTGELGGYNFQWAFSSAFVCSKNLKV